jgi:hypothetical protein
MSVPKGRHHLHVISPDGRVGYREIMATDGDALEVTVSLANPVLGIPASTSSGRSSQIGVLYGALGRLSGVDLVLLMGTDDQQRTRLQLYGADVGGFSPSVLVDDAHDVGGVVDGVIELMEGLTSTGQVEQADATFVAVPLDVAANAILSAMLLTPSDPSAIAPALGVDFVSNGPAPKLIKPRTPPSRTDVSTKPKWPIYVGVGAGVVVAGGVTALAVLLGGQGRGGTVTFGEVP